MTQQKVFAVGQGIYPESGGFSVLLVLDGGEMLSYIQQCHHGSHLLFISYINLHELTR